MNPLHPVYEILAREGVYAYNNPAFNQTEINAAIQSFGYRVDQFFDDPSTGFQALGLVPLVPQSGLAPILVFRGADQLIDDAAASDRREIARNQFDANKAAIGQWLAKFQGDPVRPTILGHSMGAALAQQVAAEFVPQVGEIVTFNAPGVSAATAATFLAGGGVSRSVTHYIVAGDVVSLGGQAFIDGKVVLLSFTAPQINPIRALDKHGEIRRYLSQPPAGFTQQEISVATLSSPGFNFNQDPDYRQLLAGLGFVQPLIAPQLVSRASVERLRTTPGTSFFGLIFTARAALSPARNNLLLGNDLPNTADGAGGDDLIYGRGAVDVLRGGAGSDRIFGGTGNDQLTGGTGNDLLVGEAGNDRLIGVEPTSARPGRGELDRLQGGTGRNRFVLGDRTHVYYDDGQVDTLGLGDYALITDFTRGDAIQLKGRATDYVLQPFSVASAQGTGIFRRATAPGSQNELIGLIEGVSGLNLASFAFAYV
jgi:serralysin